MYEEKNCFICAKHIDPIDAWSIIKITWILHRNEIHENSSIHMNCIAKNLKVDHFVMSHPLFEINLFIRTKWVGEFDTTINILYNQPIHIPTKNLIWKINNKEFDNTLNNNEIELNFFFHFLKLKHINDWFKNILYFLLPIISRMLVIGNQKPEIEYKLKRLTKFFNLDIILSKMILPKKISMKYSYDVYERSKDPNFQKCYTNLQIEEFEYKPEGIEILYKNIVNSLKESYLNISQPYLHARKYNKYKPQRIRAFEMDELIENK